MSPVAQEELAAGNALSAGTAPAAAGAHTAAQASPPGQAPTFKDVLQQLAGGRDLTQADAAWALGQIVEGGAGEVEAAAFLMALRVKGETAGEIAGLLDTMRRLVVPVETPYQDALVDVVGTGGDYLGTFNISTTAALVAAGAGARVAKHGNRAASSRCGSADVLEALGVRIDLTPTEVAACLDRVGIGFMLASLHHPAMGKVAGVRRALGVRTVFNFLGPLTNPAGVRRLLFGVSAPEYLGVLAGALARTGCEQALVVCAEGGMDELSVTGPSTVVEVKAGVVGSPYSFEPEAYGIARHEQVELTGGDPTENAAITRAVLHSKGAAGAGNGQRDVVLLNAAAGLYVAGVASSIGEGVELARASIESGRAAQVLDDMVAVTNELARARG
jgi:anthranilate phosphoribosyltransferase